MTSWQSRTKNFCAALFVSALATPAAFAVPTLSIVATPNPALTTAPVTLSITITDVADLYGYQFSLAFDPTVLQVTGGTEGVFLGTGGETTFDAGTFNNTAGTISLSYASLITDIPGVTGSGILAQYSFSVLKAGSTALTFSEVLFLDSDINDITVTAVNSTLLTTSPVVTPSIPEPGTYALMALGLAGLAVAARRRQSV